MHMACCLLHIIYRLLSLFFRTLCTTNRSWKMAVTKRFTSGMPHFETITSFLADLAFEWGWNKVRFFFRISDNLQRPPITPASIRYKRKFKSAIKRLLAPYGASPAPKPIPIPINFDISDIVYNADNTDKADKPILRRSNRSRKLRKLLDYDDL